MYKKNIRAFTLVELMIVIAIIGILSSIAIPSYQHYLKRARFSEIIMSTSPFKIAVTIDLQEGIPTDQLNNNNQGIPASPKPTKNLESIYVNHGIITATATKLAGGYNYILTPNETGSHWTTSGTCVQSGICKQ